MSLPRADLDFLLFDWLDTAALCARPAFAHLDRDDMAAMLDQGLQLAAAKFEPHAAKSDANEPCVHEGKVALIPEIGEAIAAYRDAGFFGMTTPLADGGLGLPYTLVSAI